jgi:hypothetical protein
MVLPPSCAAACAAINAVAAQTIWAIFIFRPQRSFGEGMTKCRAAAVVGKSRIL